MLDASEFDRIQAALREADGNKTRAADLLGIPRTTMISRIAHFERQSKLDRVTFPKFASDADAEEPVDELLDRLEKDYVRAEKARDARTWFTIKVRETKPYGILKFGDIHLGDPGCNVPLLRKHLEIAKQDGIYSINMGDTQNRWVGRLIKKYMEQPATRSQENRLSEWLLRDSGAAWIVWLLGNHDMWDDGVSFFKRLAPGLVPMLEWNAKFHIEHPNGSKVSFDLSHGRKGKSLWNELHGTLRDAKLGAPAHVFGTGHTHNFAMEKIEIPERRAAPWLLQTSGYKRMDSFARDNGFLDYERGSSILIIVDPSDAAEPVYHCFDDIEKGAAVLRWLRAV